MIQSKTAEKISTLFVDTMDRIEQDILKAAAKGKTGIHYLYAKENNKDLISLFLEAEKDGSENIAKKLLENHGYKVFTYFGVNIMWGDNALKAFEYDMNTGEPFNHVTYIEKL